MPTEAADSELSVAFDALQPAVVELNVDYLRLYSETDSQYVYLDVTVTAGSRPSRSDFAFRFDGDRYTPMLSGESPTLYRTMRSSGGGRYDPQGDDDGSGWMLFELPETGDASESALVWPGGEWRPDEHLRARLAAPSPSLSLEEWNVPETVALDGSTRFEFTVRNDGDYAGQFVGGINAEGWAPHRPVRRISRRIPPGAVRSWEVAGEEIELDEGSSDRVGDGDSDISYELVWSGDDRERAVSVVEK